MEWKKAIKCWKYIFKDWGVGSTWGRQCRGLQRCSKSRWRSPSSSFGPASTKVAPGGIDTDPAPFEKVTFIGFSFWRFFQKCFSTGVWVFGETPIFPMSLLQVVGQQMILDFPHKTTFRFFRKSFTWNSTNDPGLSPQNHIPFFFATEPHYVSSGKFHKNIATNVTSHHFFRLL